MSDDHWKALSASNALRLVAVFAALENARPVCLGLGARSRRPGYSTNAAEASGERAAQEKDATGAGMGQPAQT